MTQTAFAEVAVNVPQVSGLFHYHIPSELIGQVLPGSLVIAPFGKQHVQGVVTRLLNKAEVKETRAIEALIDPLPVLTTAQLELGHWLSETTLAPLAACFNPMIPPGLNQQADTLFHLNAGKVEEDGLGSMQRRLVQLLKERGDLRGRQIDSVLPKHAWRPAARSLLRRGWLVTRPVLQPPSVRPKTIRTVRLACAPEQVEERMQNLGRAGSAALERRQAVLRFLINEPWPVDVSWVYAVSKGNLQDLHKLEEEGLVALGESETWRDPLEQMDIPLSEPPVLTEAQQNAWESVRAEIQQARYKQTTPLPFLLHGITGSGKTEIYMRAVEETLRIGRQALILVPEIALTPQTVRRFLARFPGQVGLIHSRLSPGERFDTWRRARAGQLPLIVGPRSALFAPLPDPGLIVVDEFHDGSYHQDETQPNYDAVETAITYARLNKSILILGSATPDIGLFYRAQQARWNILQLPVRILAHRQAVEAQLNRMGINRSVLEVQKAGNESSAAALNLPPVKIIDMRQELKAGNRTIFSRELQGALKQVIETQQQAILFLNRRGTATYVFCRACGFSLKCPRCDLPLTLHTSETGLVCHTCNYRRQVPKQCPQCSSPHIRQFGTGTEKVESDVQALFPGVRTLRWDAETTRQKGAHDMLLQSFMNHQADILIGTQMLAKGLDLPLVTLVGVILADVGLQLPDYNAGERTFQLLTQVAGRAGRSLLGGKVILQTFQPDHYVVRAAAAHDYKGFYRQELEYRKRMHYPPFTHLLRLETRHADPQKAESEARVMSEQLQSWIQQGDYPGMEIIGPVPCFFGRQNSLYRWQIILRGPNPADVLRGRLLGDWRVEVNPTSLL
jgi:primosomal protein N' (replication factor Y) (superfamily II helicase)